MKLVIAAAVAATSLLAIAAPAAAQEWSGSVGYTTTRDSGGFQPTAITARLSWKSSSIWGIEGEGTFGSGSDTVGLVNKGIDTSWGVYGTVTAPVSDNFELLARLGYATNRVTITPGADLSDESINYGVAAQWWFSGPNGVRLDYTQTDYQTAGNGTSNAWTISYVRKF